MCQGKERMAKSTKTTQFVNSIGRLHQKLKEMRRRHFLSSHLFTIDAPYRCCSICVFSMSVGLVTFFKQRKDQGHFFVLQQRQ